MKVPPQFHWLMVCLTKARASAAILLKVVIQMLRTKNTLGWHGYNGLTVGCDIIDILFVVNAASVMTVLKKHLHITDYDIVISIYCQWNSHIRSSYFQRKINIFLSVKRSGQSSCLLVVAISLTLQKSSRFGTYLPHIYDFLISNDLTNILQLSITKRGI